MAEGIRLLEESLKFKKRPRIVYFVPSLVTPRAEKLIDNFRKFSIPIQTVAVKAMNQISDAETSQGVLGLFDIPNYSDKTLFNDSRYILLLDNISDPGNAGTLIRSALAFGFDTVMVLTNSVDPYNPKVVRSTAGAIFGLKVIMVDLADIIKEKRNMKIPLIATDSDGNKMETGLKIIKSFKNFIVVIGSEGTGISGEIKKMADLNLRIDHRIEVESLNAAVAGSIIMRELYSQKIVKVK